MSDAWVKANSRHPDNCREYDVIFADVAGEKVAELEAAAGYEATAKEVLTTRITELEQQLSTLRTGINLLKTYLTGSARVYADNLLQGEGDE